MENEPVIVQKVDAEATIMGILSQVMAMGANDSERSALMSIIDAYHKKIISVEDAVSQAEGIRDAKNAYH